MRIYLVRHGETIWNTEGRIQGWKNSNLTEKGIEDAKALGKYLRDVDFQCAFTSPFQRAIDTTKFILGDKNTGTYKISVGNELVDWLIHDRITNIRVQIQIHKFLNVK